MSVMMEASTGSPQVNQIANWAEIFHLDHPVLADTSQSQSRYVIGYPTYIVIDREMVIVNDDMYPFDENYIRNFF